MPFIEGLAVGGGLATWSEFNDFVRENENLKGYIFRGQTCATWQLTPTLFRLLQRAPTRREEAEHLQRFRLAIRGRLRLPDRDYLSDDEIWSIGQHHGLATPLLDWTASPLVAAFFAFEKRASGSPEPRAVWGLNAQSVNTWFYKRVTEELKKGVGSAASKIKRRMPRSFGDSDNEEHFGRFIQAISDMLVPAEPMEIANSKAAIENAEQRAIRVVSPLSGENGRLVNQRGLFTRSDLAQPVDDLVATKSRRITGEVLFRCELPETERVTALASLDAANINSLSLFPDITGSARFCNTKLSGFLGG